MINNFKKFSTVGIDSDLLVHLKNDEEYLKELADLSVKQAKLLGDNLINGNNDNDLPEEIKNNFTRMSELVLLIETVKSIRK